MKEENQDILNIQLSPNGIFYLKKSFLLGKWLFGIGIGGTIVAILLYLTRFFYIRKMNNSDHWIFFVDGTVFPLLGIMQMILVFFQVYYYFIFLQQCNKSISANDEAGFNRSFQLFYKNTRLSLIQFLLNLLFGLFYLYFYWELFAMH